MTTAGAAGTRPAGRSLRIAGVCFVRSAAERHELLSVRKRGTASFMLPGGKVEPGESAVQCAVREVAEELTVGLSAGGLLPLGDFEAEAANEPDTTVVSSVFLAPADALDRCRGASAPEGFQLAAEIVEAFWCPLDLPPSNRAMAPLTVDHVLPALRARFGC